MNSIYVARKPLIHIRDATSYRMWLVSSVALLVIIQSALHDNYASLIVALVAVVSAIVMELAINGVRGTFTLNDGSAVTTALILSLLMPNSIHPVIVSLGAIFAIGVVKHVYGGLGTNWLNPALGGWLFTLVSWPERFSEALNDSVLQTFYQAIERGVIDVSGSPLAILKIVGYKVSSQDSILTGIVNHSLFSLMNAELPSGYFDFFSLSSPAIIADRGILMLLIGTIILTAFRINKPLIPAMYIASYLFLIRLFGAIPFGGSFGNGDMIFGLLHGGTLLSAFILATDPGTGTKSYEIGILVAGIAAIFGFIFRYLGGVPYGALYGILITNTLIPTIRSLEIRLFYTNRRSL
ncbi:RnfABCDGE type electron transport complex subunit D [Gracilinema caldarium]|uniref:Electron transport complex, RnfABCDGE type, D subunit n=1 Tax=Gracilinema caldarium (strain ATCC 51460 / DSM 7334 / H1) TaxID=744872 RepID=F8F1U0_GRAC1|nr:RnfABCDGE type electron transport complex subunit D [Gracilinema caldarium]AEJ19424.1 electron transport complex, RnfABCDGE type, D subunit [Gracilinema caldarium DSM 7334]